MDMTNSHATFSRLPLPGTYRADWSNLTYHEGTLAFSIVFLARVASANWAIPVQTLLGETPINIEGSGVVTTLLLFGAGHRIVLLCLLG